MDGAARRLRREHLLLERDPEHGMHVAPLETNILNWHFVILGPPDSPYEGGWYAGRLIFPKTFPMAPPGVMMHTPSGRFACGQRICMSLSDFHPELWNPTWSVRTILIALVSFFNSDELTTGALTGVSDQERVRLARASLEYTVRDDTIRTLFPQLAALHRERQADPDAAWPPPRPPPPQISAATRAALEQSAKATKAAEDSFVGKPVEVHGTSRADLNGKIGECSNFEEASGRFVVDLGEGTVLKFKPANLRVVTAGSAPPPPPGPTEANGAAAADDAAAEEGTPKKLSKGQKKKLAAKRKAQRQAEAAAAAATDGDGGGPTADGAGDGPAEPPLPPPETAGEPGDGESS